MPEPIDLAVLRDQLIDDMRWATATQLQDATSYESDRYTYRLDAVGNWEAGVDVTRRDGHMVMVTAFGEGWRAQIQIPVEDIAVFITLDKEES